MMSVQTVPVDPSDRNPLWEAVKPIVVPPLVFVLLALYLVWGLLITVRMALVYIVLPIALPLAVVVFLAAGTA